MWRGAISSEIKLTEHICHLKKIRERRKTNQVRTRLAKLAGRPHKLTWLEKSTDDDDDDGWNDNYYGDVDNIDEIDDKNYQKHTNIMTCEKNLTNFRAYLKKANKFGQGASLNVRK